MMDRPTPYKSTPVFNENTLPAGLRKEHRTKAGVWGLIRVLEGQVKYRVLEPVSETILDPDHPGLVPWSSSVSSFTFAGNSAEIMDAGK